MDIVNDSRYFENCTVLQSLCSLRDVVGLISTGFFKVDTLGAYHVICRVPRPLGTCTRCCKRVSHGRGASTADN